MSPYLWEGFPILAPLTVRSNQTIFTVEKLDKSIDRLTHPSQRWDLSFGVKTNSRDDVLFKVMTEAFANKRTMVMPTLNSAHVSGLNKPVLGKVKLNGAHSSGDSTISFDNLSHATATGAGTSTFVQFANHDKVYALTSTANFSAAAGTGTFSIFPSLRKDVPDATNIKFYDDVTFHYYLDDSNIQGITYYDGIISGVDTISIWEAI